LNQIKTEFLLDPSITYLNHGSFGACPKPVIEEYKYWQLRMEKEPVLFLDRQFDDLMTQARETLADFVGCESQDLVYFSNPTTAVNMVARSFISGSNPILKPGDVILSSDHEYGAIDRTWEYYCKPGGVIYRKQPIDLPVGDPDELTEAFWTGVDSSTKMIFISHISSPTAIQFPVKQICSLAAEKDILIFVDGAHVPGQIDLNLTDLNPSIYTGACHKWLCAPKGAAFLYTQRELQKHLDPLVISWGYQSDLPPLSEYIEYHQWQGTRDISAFLSVPAAIDFQKRYDWEKIRAQCSHLLVQYSARIEEITGRVPVSKLKDLNQMAAFSLPDNVDPVRLQNDLFRDFRIEVPVYRWQDRNLLRVSVQGYNEISDLENLLHALKFLIHKSYV
jgi:isopenicillin-N epimerase